MSDTEMLNLIEHYEWNINQMYKGWNVFSANIDITGPTLREAIKIAMDAQVKWSLGKRE